MTYRTSAKLPYGPLELHEVYFAHDGPKFFSLRSARFSMFLVASCVDENESSLEFLYLVLGQERFNAIRAGELTLLEAYSGSQFGDLWHVTESTPEAGDSAEQIAFADIDPSWLPSPTARLDLPTPTVAPLDIAELTSLSEGTMRHVMALELTPTAQIAPSFLRVA